MMVEFYEGHLPWRDIKNHEEVLNAKVTFPLQWLVKDAPKQLGKFGDHLMSLE